MKKLLSFILLFLYIIGIIGGIGYTVYYKAYPIALGIAVTGWMALVRVKELFKVLTN